MSVSNLVMFFVISHASLVCTYCNLLTEVFYSVTNLNSLDVIIVMLKSVVRCQVVGEVMSISSQSYFWILHKSHNIMYRRLSTIIVLSVCLLLYWWVILDLCQEKSHLVVVAATAKVHLVLPSGEHHTLQNNKKYNLTVTGI